MTFSLSDIPTAIAAYIRDNVTVTVTEVTHGISTVLQPNEKGKFDVVVTNSGGVRLTGLVYELSVSPESAAKLVSPSTVVRGAREGLDPSSDLIPNGNEIGRMFLFPIAVVDYASVDPGTPSGTPSSGSTPSTPSVTPRSRAPSTPRSTRPACSHPTRRARW
jgi:hypothetical protein